MYPKEFSPVLALGLILICVYLLMTGRLTGGQFWPALIVSLVMVAVIHNLDVIDNLTVKTPGGTEAVVQMQRLRAEIYAKVEELQQVAIGVATFTAASIVSENRFVSEDDQENMLRRRDDLEKFLAEAGVADQRRREIIEPITRMADWDMRHAIIINAVAAWRVPAGSDPNRPAARDQLQRSVEQVLQQPDRLKGLAKAEDLVRHLFDESNPILIRSIENYRRMLTSGRLPAVGSQDDLRAPPPM